MGAISAGDPSQPLLLCLHGWGGSRDIWLRFLQIYGGTRRVVSVDLPGTWESSPVADWTASALTSWVLDVADGLGAHQFALMGHSMGGNLAAHVASASPERVTDLILVDAAVYSDRIDTVRCYLAPGYGRPLLEAARLASGFLGIFSQIVQEHSSGGVWRPWLRRCRYFYHHNGSEAMTQQLQGLVESPFDPAALSPRINVLVFHGEKDTVVPISMAHELVGAIRKHRDREGVGQTSLLVYPDSNHVPMDVEPARFAGDVRAFLDGV